jgi:hypothetical protein
VNAFERLPTGRAWCIATYLTNWVPASGSRRLFHKPWWTWKAIEWKYSVCKVPGLDDDWPKGVLESPRSWEDRATVETDELSKTASATRAPLPGQGV